MRALAPLLVLSLALPAVFADPGSWYEESGTLTTTAGFVYDADNAWVWLDQGDVIVATFTWDPADGSAVAWIQEGGISCRAQDVDCLLDSLETDTNSPICPDRIEYGGSAFSGSPQSITLTAATTGWHNVAVRGVLIPVELPYHLHVSVNGAAPATIVPNSTLIGLGGGDQIWCPLL